MEQKLIELGFSEKEALVYLGLLEFGAQPASVVARRLELPRPTVLFLFQNLVKRGLVRKSMRGRTQIFFADPGDLEVKIGKEIEERSLNLGETVKLLKEFKNPLTEQPKVTFFEGVDGCRKAYLMILESKEVVFEIGNHQVLERMGVEFMENFIKERVKLGVRILGVDRDTPINRDFQQKDEVELRELRVFDEKKFGRIYSSLVIFENRVLLLNLREDCFGILIENWAVAESMKTVFRLGWG